MRRIESREDGEYMQCRVCVDKGYGEDAWLPMTDEFWPRDGKRLNLSRCKACFSELRARNRPSCGQAMQIRSVTA